MLVAAADLRRRLAAWTLLPIQFRAGRRSATRGFTLVELVVVMVLIGIVAAVGMARFADNKSFEMVAYADRVAGMLRFGQKLAVAQNRPVYIVVDGDKVALCYDAACSQQVSSPSGNNSGSTTTVAECASSQWECEAPPPGVTFASGVGSFYFDPLGKPFASVDTYPSLNSTFAKLTLTVSGGGGTHDVVVEQESGYVH